MTATAEGDLTVFVIGMRVNRLAAPRAWWPTFRAMRPMLRELSRDPDSGLLGFQLLLGLPRVVCTVQYWESPEKLIAYASDPAGHHRPAWAAFNRRARDSRGAVGIWHETYVVRAGSYETVYVDMPEFGLGRATGTAPVGRRGERAAQRLARPGSADPRAARG
ncbi:DUF4188 domain-containing protein [Streptomyces sp. B1866]|uniref:DUF4188 domain-containing protein n=1 Tax=Streptomyces sp. B1866 TaxID=3075431 RepID=UPI0028916BBF|nr:DUF4188 domain-containing protein [Streptomyces sp. B1866]MDT3399368.1 DUF4188 domain-containing protein [Streptomyces sp. B1866]